MKDFYFSNNDDEREFLKSKKWMIHSLIFDSVKKAFEEDLEVITVFRIINPISNYVMTTDIRKTDWEGSLKKSLSFFESIEEYEKCKEIKDLLKNIGNVTNKSNRSEKQNKKGN